MPCGRYVHREDRFCGLLESIDDRVKWSSWLALEGEPEYSIHNDIAFFQASFERRFLCGLIGAYFGYAEIETLLFQLLVEFVLPLLRIVQDSMR